ncbi:hypothetical protein AVO42_00655 [Thiomicrospira sp. XS5]|uniref:hypothetical protein n=1 Tax=Thiomicrospira sp. XS5 TaxID=1775636 RepID=UPI00074A707F|nr:hypothetical protein [Thiomicrospira sp. XS5]KUJ73964.1 hypothetical protein AVO42_00655 [Thiomicrospira sp. XS5]
MLFKKIENWIQQLNTSHKQVRRSCANFDSYFEGFYSPEFLKKAYFVVTEEVPKPDYPELQEAGLGEFLELDAHGITYGDTYYIKKSHARNAALHFHELVHVCQYQNLTQQGFIKRYIQEIQYFGYDESPLEKMAYQLEDHYRKSHIINVEKTVRENL